jgi:hypothetical protein
MVSYYAAHARVFQNVSETFVDLCGLKKTYG